MTPEKFASLIAVGVFASGMIGLLLGHLLPEKYTTGPARDMIGAVVGLLTLLSALTLGLLIWTAYGVYAGQNTSVQTLAAKALQLDMALADYGPAASKVRQGLKEGVRTAIDQIWKADLSDKQFIAKNFAAALRNIKARESALANLRPTTDDERTALATATSTLESIGQSRLQMTFALANPVAIPVVLTVVGWVSLLFLGYGLTSKGSPASILAAIVGALAVASGFYMILDLSSPYSGAFRPSPAPLEQVLSVMGKD